MNLHECIAKTLGWTVAETQSFSLPALRDLVRPVDSKLAHEITQVMQGGYRANPAERRVFTYTTAPTDYDWFGTTTVKIAGHDKRGRPIRLVTSDPRHAQAQRGRYASGLHMVADDAEWEKLVDYKLVTVLKANPAHYVGNPGGGIGLLVGLVIAGAAAWWLFKPKPAAAASLTQPTLPTAPNPLNPCTITDKQIEAFAATKPYDVWWVADRPVATWTAPTKEQYIAKGARAFSVYECMFYKWESHEGAADAWVKDMQTAAEFDAWKKEAGA